MAWMALVFSGLMEAAWATALSRIDGLANPAAIVVFIAGMVFSMLGLGYAVRTLPVGVSYAVWTGIGVVGTVVVGVAMGTEPMTAAKALLLMGLVCCIAGLKVVSG